MQNPLSRRGGLAGACLLYAALLIAPPGSAAQAPSATDDYTLVIRKAIDQHNDAPLKEIAARGTGAVPGLVAALGPKWSKGDDQLDRTLTNAVNEDVASVAANLLATITPQIGLQDPLQEKVAAALVAALKQYPSSKEVVAPAVMALCGLGPAIERGDRPEQIVGSLLNAFVDPDTYGMGPAKQRLTQFAIPQFSKWLDASAGLAVLADAERGIVFPQSAANWLIAIGHDAVPAMIDKLRNDKDFLGDGREYAAYILASTGKDDPPAAQALLDAYSGSASAIPNSVRAGAAASLILMNKPPAGAALIIAKELPSGDDFVAYLLCRALILMPRADAELSVPTLKAWASGKDELHQKLAAATLAGLRNF